MNKKAKEPAYRLIRFFQERNAHDHSIHSEAEAA
jgi:hypothetical protein